MEIISASYLRLKKQTIKLTLLVAGEREKNSCKIVSVYKMQNIYNSFNEILNFFVGGTVYRYKLCKNR